MPEFEPVRAGRGRLGPLRAAGRWLRAVALLLAVVAAGAAFRGAPGDGSGDGDSALPAARPAAGKAPAPPPVSSDGEEGGATVEAPVRIPDAGAVRLLRPGDRVDVLATPAGTPAGGPADGAAGSARTIARNVRVAAVPEPALGPEAGPGDREGALVVLSVPRATAARLAGAAAHSLLAVTLC
ncbi:RcpC/CpaB family pilus assembly protein [Streptomyces chitinivorans]|uniref:RcpC/CpaB family pilus assembly protein n=1 Tax=Streptomyces chitinivorans TaxID=1257027 RepID=A0ABW7HN56_9ACTN